MPLVVAWEWEAYSYGSLSSHSGTWLDEPLVIGLSSVAVLSLSSAIVTLRVEVAVWWDNEDEFGVVCRAGSLRAGAMLRRRYLAARPQRRVLS